MPPQFRFRHRGKEESDKIKGYCIGCGMCADICPADAITMQKGRPVLIYADECFHCGACFVDCPVGAIYYRFSLPMLLPVYPMNFFE